MKPKNYSAIFIAGTDKNVGKTIVTGLLARYLFEHARNVITQKWVQTDIHNQHDDLHYHDAEMNRVIKRDLSELRAKRTPYRFALSGSPHLAAEKENCQIAPDQIKTSFQALCKNFEIVLIEGTGGVLTPYSRQNYLIDIVKTLKIPVLLVAQNRLGAINHTLLSIEALRARGIPLLGVVFNGSPKIEDKRVIEDNLQIIQEMGNIDTLGLLPWTENKKNRYALFQLIGSNIFKILTEISFI